MNTLLVYPHLMIYAKCQCLLLTIHQYSENNEKDQFDVLKRVSRIYIQFDTCSGNGTQPHTRHDQSLNSEMLFHRIYKVRNTHNVCHTYSTFYII